MACTWPSSSPSSLPAATVRVTLSFSAAAFAPSCIATKNGLTESLVISVTATVSPSGTGARLDSPEPGAADPLAAPLALLVAAALVAAAEAVELVAVSLLLPHAVRVNAAATAITATPSRFVIFVLPACMTTPLLWLVPVGVPIRTRVNVTRQWLLPDQ